MSKNSKNYQRLIKAREVAKMHLNGDKGPSQTNPQHGKKWGYRTNPEMQKRIAEMTKAANEQAKTAGKKILANAGGASKDAVAS